MTTDAREFDLIVWGATGFTGKLVAEHLLDVYGVNRDLRWAVAARSEQKLRSLRQELGVEANALPLLTAESHDRESLDKMAGRATCIISTVGPYALYGSELVGACVAAGTHYCDLAGEVQWMRKMIDRYESAAKDSGARIVHACGFDSIPSDLGVLFLQEAARERFGKPCSQIRMRVKAMRGGASGGTIASMMNAMAEGKADREVARIIVSPYSLNPKNEQQGPDRRDQTGPVYDEDLDAWTAPFVMAGINTKIVRRSNALMDFDYGRDFRYEEAMLTGSGLTGRLRALQLTAGIGGIMLAGSVDWLRSLLAKRMLPKPGEGPNRQQRENGFFNIVFAGRADGNRIFARVTGDRDPGYGSTSRMIGESGVCLARDDLDTGGGFWTPASAMGKHLIRRLQASAGLEFTIEED
jgi:short subunit dehydrogenase-like uncharacterized protein